MQSTEADKHGNNDNETFSTPEALIVVRKLTNSYYMTLLLPIIMLISIVLRSVYVLTT